MPNHPRRRAKQDRSLQTVDAVLDAAAQVLTREGYARATTNRIAHRAGVSVGTVYQYFRDKDAVFEALIRRQIDALLEALGEYRLDVSKPLDQTLREILALGVRVQPYGPDLYRVLEYVPNALFRRHVNSASKSLQGFVRTVLEAYRDELRVSDLDTAAYVIVSASEGLGYHADAKHFNQRLVDQLTDLFSRYLLRDPGDTAAWLRT
jgi:AcrR family transcriptional regulator